MLFKAGGDESPRVFEPQQGLCLVALIAESSSSSNVAFLKVSRANVFIKQDVSVVSV